MIGGGGAKLMLEAGKGTLEIGELGTGGTLTGPFQVTDPPLLKERMGSRKGSLGQVRSLQGV